MILPSNPQPTGLVPINRQSVQSGISLEDRFNDASRSLYSKYSPYDATSGEFSIGFRQPYVWAGLNDSEVWKYIKKYDNTTFPVGATIQDTQRVAKFVGSGRGALYIGKQFALQNQNAFNETRIFNPLSVVTTTGTTALSRIFGDSVSHPTRHIETSGGGLFSTIKDGFLTTIGIQTKAISGKVAPTGTATLGLEALSLEAKSGGGWASKGLTRYQSSVSGRERFVAKFSSNGKDKSGNTIISNFLSSLGKSIISKVTSFIPNTGGYEADWKYRVEESDTVSAYDAFIKDRNSLLSYSVNGQRYEVGDVIKFYWTADKDFLYFGTGRLAGDINEPSSALEGLGSTLEKGIFDYTRDVNGKLLGKPSDKTGLTTKTQVKDILGESDTSRANVARAVQTWNLNKTYGKIDADFFTGGAKTYKQLRETEAGSYRKSIKDKTQIVDYSEGKGFALAGKPDEYNELYPIKQQGNSIPDELLTKTRIDSKDTIFFYFYDVINSVYIPFRAAINSINENTSVDWEDFQYIGRADRLYMYKGFTRELNFIFTVYANSVSELEPMWSRINYLSGLSRPSKYTSGTSNGKLGEFMYPPMVKLTVGDLYMEQPIVIRTFGLNVPDDAPWETCRRKYEYLNGMITSDKKVAQVPMKVDITVSCALIEKEKSVTQTLRYFDQKANDFGAIFGVPSVRDKKNKEAALAADARNLAMVNALKDEKADTFEVDTNYLAPVPEGLSFNNYTDPAPNTSFIPGTR